MNELTSQASLAAFPYWAPDCDGTDKYPENHRLIWESERARVVRVFIGAGKAEAAHTHALFSLMFVDQPTKIAVRLVNALGQEKLVFERKEPQVSPLHPRIDAMDPEPYHYVSNTDERDYLATRIEIKNVRRALNEKGIEREGLPFLAHDTPSYQVLRLSIEPSETTLALQDKEGYLIGNVDTAFKIYQYVQEKKLLLLPLDNLEKRPPVWFLSPCTSYVIENLKGQSENIYLLEV